MTASSIENQLLTFTLADDQYAVDLPWVQEVLRLPAATPIPRAPWAIRGLMNLRGEIVSILDLGHLLNLPEQSCEPEFAVVVIQEGRKLALSVPRVGDVYRPENTDIHTTPPTLQKALQGYVDRTCRIEGRLVTVINLEKIFSLDFVPDEERIPLP